ncbi:MAG TPA: squalene/phytoene synthase family protein [Thermoanaerobaculia bacterium]|nr:squalene/phytoene synthase family protein [Thermoanaerobaculia bacterium]
MQPETRQQAWREPDLEQLLIATSRTFALAIPLLPEPTRREVTISYLLFRIADTFEDAAAWPQALRIAALERFIQLLEAPDREEIAAVAALWAAEVPVDQPGYRELLAAVPFVFDSFLALAPEAMALIREHTVRTAYGMAAFVARTGDDGELSLRDVADLQSYCYTVAGIVGELLTELFILGRPAVAAVASNLRQRARAFGEGLQLVNILKDSASDATDGRRYLPEGVDRAAVLDLARRDLQQAADYVLTLQAAGAERGLVAFNALPVRLAHATLVRVEQAGPGSKITRSQVYAIVQSLNRALDRGDPAVELG